MRMRQFFVPGLAINTYAVGDERTGEAAVVDPTRDIDGLIDWARAEGLRIRHIFETHVHADFVSGARELKARLHDEPKIYCSGEGGEGWTPPYADVVLKDGDCLRMGRLRFDVLHTPGHTPEHVSYALVDTSRDDETPWLIFTGDFLFVGDVGRPDLLGPDERKKLAHQLYTSVFDKLPGLPEYTEIFPAHGAGSLCGKAIGSRDSSTLGYERRFSDALQHKPEPRWVNDLLAQMPLAPPYFSHMKQVNRDWVPIIGPQLPGQRRINADAVHERVCERCLIVDVRSKEAFAAAHIPDSINIPFGPNLATWAGWVLAYDQPIIVVTDEPAQTPRIAADLIRVGFDDIVGYLEGGIDAWQMRGYPVATLRTISVHDLRDQLQDGQRPTVLDVRTDSEWTSGHIENALHIHGGVLQNHLDEVPSDQPLAVVCGSGYRAAIAASFLQRAGYENVMNVLGGMTAWQAAKLPVVMDAAPEHVPPRRS
ncbi:MAG: MBL fold metallo-hydrolase [Phycisphaeraceae bacterium]